MDAGRSPDKKSTMIDWGGTGGLSEQPTSQAWFCKQSRDELISVRYGLPEMLSPQQ